MNVREYNQNGKCTYDSRKRETPRGEEGNMNSPIRVYPKKSTGLWDGAFQFVCKYRSDGERI